MPPGIHERVRVGDQIRSAMGYSFDNELLTVVSVTGNAITIVRPTSTNDTTPRLIREETITRLDRPTHHIWGWGGTGDRADYIVVDDPEIAIREAGIEQTEFLRDLQADFPATDIIDEPAVTVIRSEPAPVPRPPEHRCATDPLHDHDDLVFVEWRGDCTQTNPETDGDGERLCRECFDTERNSGEINQCDHCHQYMYRDMDMRYLEDTNQNVCVACYENDLNGFRCEDCENYYSGNRSNYLEGYDRDVCNSCYENYRTCRSCEQAVHVDDTYYNGDTPYCQDCYDRLENTDDNDGDEHVYRDDGSTSGTIQPGGKAWEAWTTTQTAAETLGDPKTIEFLRGIYSMTIGEKELVEKLWNKWKEIDTKWIFNFDVGWAKDKARKLFNNLDLLFKRNNVATSNKFRKYTMVGELKWSKASFQYYDKFGNVKVREDSLMWIQEYLTKNEKKYLWVEQPPVFTIEDFKWADVTWRMTNNMEHKIALAKANGELGSCQTWKHMPWLAEGLRDWFNDDAKIPIGLFRGDRVIGRILVRQMLTSSWWEYLFIDRPYLTDILAGKKEEILSMVVKELLKLGHKVVVSKDSSHDRPNYEHLNNTGGFILTALGETLRSPKRRMWFKTKVYYQDSWGKAYRDEAGLVYDYLNKKSAFVATLRT